MIGQQGMPIRQSPTKRGKLFVEYSVLFPTGKKFSGDEKKSTCESTLSAAKYLAIASLFGSTPSASSKVGATSRTGKHDEL